MLRTCLHANFVISERDNPIQQVRCPARALAKDALLCQANSENGRAIQKKVIRNNSLHHFFPDPRGNFLGKQPNFRLSWSGHRQPASGAPSFELSFHLNDGYLVNVTNERAGGVAEATSRE